jgi:triphosphoribosyl-dephospho-CoA synthase
MDAASFLASIAAIEPFFSDLARAGAEGANLPRLQQIGLAAEHAMEQATGGRNTHRGAIFSIGLLAAAAGWRARAESPASLGMIVRERWADGILLSDDLPGGSDGIVMGHRHGVGGARREAKEGFPSVYRIGLPALRKAGPECPGACVQVFFELLAQCEDTTLMKRGGREGWQFGLSEARRFLETGGIFVPGWQATAEEIHRAFIARNLTAGGVADLLAATLFVHRIEEGR